MVRVAGLPVPGRPGGGARRIQGPAAYSCSSAGKASRLAGILMFVLLVRCWCIQGWGIACWWLISIWCWGCWDSARLADLVVGPDSYRDLPRILAAVQVREFAVSRLGSWGNHQYTEVYLDTVAAWVLDLVLACCWWSCGAAAECQVLQLRCARPSCRSVHCSALATQTTVTRYQPLPPHVSQTGYSSRLSAITMNCLHFVVCCKLQNVAAGWRGAEQCRHDFL